MQLPGGTQKVARIPRTGPPTNHPCHGPLTRTVNRTRELHRRPVMDCPLLRVYECEWTRPSHPFSNLQVRPFRITPRLPILSHQGNGTDVPSGSPPPNQGMPSDRLCQTPQPSPASLLRIARSFTPYEGARGSNRVVSLKRIVRYVPAALPIALCIAHGTKASVCFLNKSPLCESKGGLARLPTFNIGRNRPTYDPATFCLPRKPLSDSSKATGWIGWHLCCFASVSTRTLPRLEIRSIVSGSMGGLNPSLFPFPLPFEPRTSSPKEMGPRPWRGREPHGWEDGGPTKARRTYQEGGMDDLTPLGWMEWRNARRGRPSTSDRTNDGAGEELPLCHHKDERRTPAVEELRPTPPMGRSR